MFCKIIHLGKNPKKGGNPPNLRRFKKIKGCKYKGRCSLDSWLIWVILLYLIIITTGRSRIIYIQKYIIIRFKS